ncbi:MAG: TatD family hydrolase [Ignavibacteria bacterium]
MKNQFIRNSEGLNEGIERIIVPAVDLNTSVKSQKCLKNDMICCALGVHPCDVKDNKLSVFDELEKLLGHEKVVAIGETGLVITGIKQIEDQKEFSEDRSILQNRICR